MRTFILALLLIAGTCRACDEHNCGEVSINVVGFIEANSSAPAYVVVSIENKSCKPVGYTPATSAKGQFLFTRESPVRWESQLKGSDQWVSYLGLEGEPRPIGKITLLLQHDERASAYVELGPAAVKAPDANLRIFLTDTQGVSRSSNVFSQHSLPRQDLVQ